MRLGFGGGKGIGGRKPFRPRAGCDGTRFRVMLEANAGGIIGKEIKGAPDGAWAGLGWEGGGQLTFPLLNTGWEGAGAEGIEGIGGLAIKALTESKRAGVTLGARRTSIAKDVCR